MNRKAKPAYPYQSHGQWRDRRLAEAEAEKQRLAGYETLITKCSDRRGGHWHHLLRR